MSALLTLFTSHGHDLKQEGRTFKTCCPFHDDSTPSLSIDPQKGLWQCFGCGEGGDGITFLEKSFGLSFGEAADRWREFSGQDPKYTQADKNPTSPAQQWKGKPMKQLTKEAQQNEPSQKTSRLQDSPPKKMSRLQDNRWRMLLFF